VPSTGLAHEAVTEGKRGSPISITVGVQSDLKFDKLVLAYRPEGASEFLGREMKQVSDGTYVAEIPTSATAGGTVAYYIEADEKDGAPVAGRGSPESPLVISLVGGSRPPAVSRKIGGGDEEDSDEDDDEGGTRWMAALLLGSGAGYTTGNGDSNVNTEVKPAGIAPATLGHIAPEVGYWLRPNMMVSVQLRLQRVSGTTDYYMGNGSTAKVLHTANYAAAAFAKVTWRLRSGPWYPFFSLAAGGGQIRHVVSFANQNVMDCGPNHTEVCKDTIAGGPILVGPGGGLAWDLSDRVALLFQVNTQLGFPNFTFNVDGNIGAGMKF
jgi:hypothetical protein